MGEGTKGWGVLGKGRGRSLPAREAKVGLHKKREAGRPKDRGQIRGSDRSQGGGQPHRGRVSHREL